MELSLREAVRGYRDTLDVVSRAAEARAREEAHAHGAKLSCTRGCAWCCHQKILTSATEGAVIYVTLRRDGQWTRELSTKLLGADSILTHKTHNAVLTERIPCALLVPGSVPGRGVCSIYPVRPLGCRTWYAIADDPIKCADPNGSGFAVLVSGAAVEALTPYFLSFEAALGTNGAAFTLPGAVLYAAARIEGKPDPGVHRVERAGDGEDAVTYADRFDRVAG
jgi:hypothetical protein